MYTIMTEKKVKKIMCVCVCWNTSWCYIHYVMCNNSGIKKSINCKCRLYRVVSMCWFTTHCIHKYIVCAMRLTTSLFFSLSRWFRLFICLRVKYMLAVCTITIFTFLALTKSNWNSIPITQKLAFFYPTKMTWEKKKKIKKNDKIDIL